MVMAVKVYYSVSIRFSIRSFAMHIFQEILIGSHPSWCAAAKNSTPPYQAQTSALPSELAATILKRSYPPNPSGPSSPIPPYSTALSMSLP